MLTMYQVVEILPNEEEALEGHDPLTVPCWIHSAWPRGETSFVFTEYGMKRKRQVGNQSTAYVPLNPCKFYYFSYFVKGKIKS